VGTNVPLTALINAARHGNIQLVDETGQIFTEHAFKLIEVCSKIFNSPIKTFVQVANIVCSMSDSIEGIKLVRLAAKQIENLSPQVGQILKVRSVN
jgi:hypothetical protein